MPTDDAFFNRNWAKAYGRRWAGPGLLAGWAIGCLIVWAEIGLWHVDPLLVLKTAFLCKSKKDGGSAGASPMALPMPKSVSF